MKYRARSFLLLAALTVLLLAGCASVGRANLDSARQSLEANRPDMALVYASEALLEDPEYDQAKEFLKENAEAALAQITQFVTKAKTSSEPQVVEQEYDTYENLVAFYDNLEEIGLPLVKGQKLFGLIKGWEWSTPIQNYEPALEMARQHARSVFLDSGFATVDAGDLGTAKNLLEKVVTRFAIDGSDEQLRDEKNISGKFSDWAAGNHGSRNPDELLEGLEAYDIALQFDAENAVAVEGQDTMRLELSDVYVVLGLEEEQKDTIDSLEKSVAYFEKSLQYNHENIEASNGIPRVSHRLAVIYTDDAVAEVATGNIDTMRAGFEMFNTALEWDPEYSRAYEEQEKAVGVIAEYYYQEGNALAADVTNDEAVEAAIVAYDSAQEWVPDYKDCLVKTNRLYVSRQLIVLRSELGKTRGEFDRTNSRIVALSDQVTKGHEGINDIFYISDKVIQLEQQLRTIRTCVSPLSALPVVGSVFTVTGTALSTVHKPVKKVSDKVKVVQRPYITPSRELIGKVKASVDEIVATMEEIDGAIAAAQRTSERLNDCIEGIDDPDVLVEIEEHVCILNEELETLNDGLDTVNDVQDEVEGSLRSLAEAVGVVSDVTGGVERIMRPLDKIDSVTSKVDNALQQEINVGFTKFTVEEAINSSTGMVRKAAEAVLDPLLDELDISIPTVPGVEKLESILDDFEGYYNDITEAERRIEDAKQQILDVPDRMTNELTSIVEKTACSL